ncbi:transposase [Aquincola sp. S2]|uniref:Transposase n=1 Tax=Pseudaquabacterium terrae TaxID=2732868 RepID=A0ABX2ERS5_9BURK|nr:transposase [Aquabacterium terrae]
MRVLDVGETTATALVAMIGSWRDFADGRQLSAWLGLVLGQYSLGGKTRLGSSPRRQTRPCARCW